MHVRLLGPPLVVTGDREVPIRSARQGVLLGALALRPGQVVVFEDLMHALWGEDPPASARNALHVHVSGLRRLIGHRVLESKPEGYRLVTDSTTVDATVFRHSLQRAEALTDSRDWLTANRTYRSALALWQGSALGGLDGDWASTQRRTLHQQRHAARRGRFRTDLELGHHDSAADEIEALLLEEPYDEELVALLMLATYRSGNVARALAVFREARARLVTDLGVEPGARLATLHRSMLRRDARLDLDPSAAALAVPAGVRRRGALVGRTLEVHRLERLIRQDVGPITLVGPPGVGKSRLAAEVSSRMQSELPAGVAVIDCEHLVDVANVPGLVVAHLGLDLLGDPLTALRSARGLLVLDGVRPQLAAHADLVDIVDSLGMPVLVTAHQPCGWALEQVFPVRPLPTSSPDDHPSPAAELLLLRAAAAGAVEEAAVDDVEACALLLDGLPLALELAAPRAVLGFADLRAHLEHERHREPAGLRLSFAASVAGRSEAQVRLMHVLSRCGGPIDTAWLEALPVLDPESVLDALSALVRDGLVREVTGVQDVSMFELLDGVRAEVLESETDGGIQWGRAVVAAHDASIGHDQLALSVLPTVAVARRRAALVPSAEHALERALELGMLTEAARIGYAVGEHMTALSHATMGRLWQRLSDPRSSTGMTTSARLAALMGIGDWASEQAGFAELTTRVADEAVALAREDGRQGSLAVALIKHLAWCFINGRECPVGLEEARQAALASEDPLAVCSVDLFVACIRGDADGLLAALSTARALGHAGLTALALANLSEMQLWFGNSHESADVAQEALGLYTALRVPRMQQAMASSLCVARALTGSSADLSRVAEMVTLSWDHDNPRLLTDVLLKLGCGFRAGGSTELAARALGVYRAYLSTNDLDVSEDEQRLIDQWLAGVDAVPPRHPLPDEVRALVAAAHGPPAPAVSS